MPKVITISGLCFTGKTSFAERLKNATNWNYISAGQRFRDYSKQNGILISEIPVKIHLEFDELIKKDIAESNNTIIEGHYLGIFAKDIPSVLRILLITDHIKRVERCFFRDPKLIDFKQADEVVKARDSQEKQIAHDLYNKKEFDDKSLFDKVIANNDISDLLSGLQQVKDEI